MNEERLLSDQTKNPSVYVKLNERNLTANGGYDHQADNQYGGNRYDHTDSQDGRYGYDSRAYNQYSGNGYGQTDSQDGRSYDHQADYQNSGNE